MSYDWLLLWGLVKTDHTGHFKSLRVSNKTNSSFWTFRLFLKKMNEVRDEFFVLYRTSTINLLSLAAKVFISTFNQTVRRRLIVNEKTFNRLSEDVWQCLRVVSRSEVWQWWCSQEFLSFPWNVRTVQYKIHWQSQTCQLCNWWNLCFWNVMVLITDLEKSLIIFLIILCSYYISIYIYIYI